MKSAGKSMELEKIIEWYNPQTEGLTPHVLSYMWTLTLTLACEYLYKSGN